MKISSIAAGLFTSALLVAPAAAVVTYYGAADRALPLQQAGGTARAAGMGSAVVAVSQGSASLLWNPAGLSELTCSEAAIHHNTGLGDTLQEIAVLGIPLKHGGLALSIGYVDYGNFEGRDIAGLPTGSYDSGDFSAAIGYGVKVFKKLSAGIVLKANQSRFGSKTYNAYTTDVGLMYALLKSVDLGLTYTNINLGAKIGGSQLASGMRLGAGWKVDKHLLLAASSELQQGSVDRYQLGVEYKVGNIEEQENILALRAGYAMTYPDPRSGGLTGLTFGLGYAFSRTLQLDYALVPTGELGNSHRLSATFKFGCPEKAQPPASVKAPPAPPLEVLPVVAAPVVLKAVLLEDSHFDFDKSVLRPEGMKALRENIELLKDNPKARVRVAGYTSASGSQEYNQLLSERRAAAVEAFLITEGGIAPGRITTIGYGEDRPKTFESSPDAIHTAAAKSNMRVLFEVTVK